LTSSLNVNLQSFATLAASHAPVKLVASTGLQKSAQPGR
jgi:hypothetical protein